MNMLAPDYAMPEGSVRDATNLDVTNEGVLRTRQGFAASPLVSGTRCHSLFASPSFLLHADGSALKRTVASTSTVATIQPAVHVAYAQLPDGFVAWSDGSSIGKVSETAALPLSIQAPGSPRLSAVSGGLLRDGRYLVCVTWVGADLVESPPSLPVAVDIAAGNGISLAGIPSSGPPGAVAMRVYCSHANEATLFESVVIPVGVTAARVDAEPTGRPLETLFEANFPACSVLGFAAGRLLGGRGSMLIWSEPFRFGVYRPRSNFIQFAAPISMIAPTQDGVYVGTMDPATGAGEVVFFSGFDFGKQAYRPVAPYAAYPGTLVSMPHNLQMGWASPQGFVIADNGGQITNISFDKVAFPLASRGGSLIREQNGTRQIITSLEPVGSTNQFAVSDYAEADIIKGASNV